MYLNYLKRTSVGGPKALFVVCISLLIMLVTAHQADRIFYLSKLQQIRSDTYMELMEVRKRFESIIHSQSLVLRELSTFIGDKPNINQADFSARVMKIRGIHESMISVAAAPNMVISLIHPEEQNRAALGLDYRTNSEQFSAIQTMYDTGKETITGPIFLVQGGKGLVLRAPVYLHDAGDSNSADNHNSGRFLWGVVSLVLDYGKFLKEAGIDQAEKNYDLLITSKNGTYELNASSLYGDQSLIGRDVVTLNLDSEFEHWVLHAIPKGGWPKTYPHQVFQRALMAIIIVIFVMTLFYVLWLSENRKRAELLLNSGIAALNDGFVMFDADDRLILSNERYRQIYDFPKSLIKPGTHVSEFFNAGLKRQGISFSNSEEANWVQTRLRSFRSREPTDTEQHFADGRVIKVSDRRLADGKYVGLRVDVTELSHAKDAAEAANKAKTDFMGVLSHELRTPLTVILGVAKISRNPRLLDTSKAIMSAFKKGEVAPDQAEKMLDEMFTQFSGLMGRVVQSGEHLLHLINEMLDVAKIESGTLVVESSLCEISKIVDPVIEQLRTLSEQKGLEFEVSQEATTVFADETKTRQILFNLIGNAIKFTEEGFVRLTISVENNMVRFEVQDSGSGIPNDQLGNIFDVFHQVDATSTRAASGTGMGLAIARSLTLLQNGTLTVSSEINEGSQFTLTLPANQDEFRN